jgi:prepilin-type N-terminal cleavage/methylation domain-containing protein
MMKIKKNKKGFTFTEIVLVVAIIVIIASAVLLGANEYLNTAYAAEDGVDASVVSLKSNITDKENDLKKKGF